MNAKKEDEDTLAWKADAAFRKAAFKVIQRAKQTGTPVVIWEDGEIKEIPPEEIECRMIAEKLPEEKE
jgi:hypothetical protein